MIGQAVGAYTDATHGMTLSAVSLPYYRFIMPYAISKFKRFAINVWNVKEEDKTDLEIANAGLKAMEEWMRKLGLVMNISELGAKENMIEGISNSILISDTGYKVLTKEEVKGVLRQSL